MNRRTFLKGLAGATAIAAIAPEALAASEPEWRIVDSGHTTPNRGGDMFPPKVDVSPGIVHIDGAHVVPGDRVLIQYSSDPSNNGVYEVKAVHVGTGQDVTLARVHEGTEVQMHRDEIGPYINREIRRRQTRATSVRGPSPRAVPSRPRRTWPQPRRSRHR
jgi:hypothetical protein